jgi:hypothetical protein
MSVTTNVLALGATTDLTFSFVTLDVADAVARVEATVVPIGGSQDDPHGVALFNGAPTSDATLPIPAGGAMTAPAVDAPIAAGTTVSWTNPLTGTQGHIVFFSAVDFSGTAVRVFYEGDTSFVFPDLSLLGATLEQEPYEVRAFSSAPGISADDWLGSIDPAFAPGAVFQSVTDARSVTGP